MKTIYKVRGGCVLCLECYYTCPVRAITIIENVSARIDPDKCIGCNRCASVCQCDVLYPSPERGKHPVVMYPGECYYCGACVMVCPKDAIELVHPLMNRAKFVPTRKPEEA